jgi:3-hydroxybutyryl-CoA dehydratase
MSYYIEDLAPGVSESMTRTVTEREVELFAEATGDRNPVHFDEAFARRTVFRGRVAHGALLIGFVSAVIGNQLPGAGTIFVSAKTDFKAPVRVGETVVTKCTVKEIRGREVVLDCLCMVGERVTLAAEAIVIAPKRPAEKTAGTPIA